MKNKLSRLFFTLSSWYKVIKELNLDVIHTQTEFTIGHIGRKAARKLGIPLIHTYHTIYEDYTHYLKFPGNQKLKGAIRSLSRVCCDKADMVVVPTKKVRNLLIKYGVKKNIIVQPTGIDLGKYQNTDQRIKLIIVGDGPEEKQLKKLVTQRRLDNCVTFTGAVPWIEIQNYYALGNVFVSASTSETQGLTYVEALASGKPLLAKRDDCLNGLLDYGENGYYFTTDCEFRSNYNKLFKDNDWSTMKDSAVSAANRISSAQFGAGIEHIYIDDVKKEKEVQAYEKIHAVAG